MKAYYNRGDAKKCAKCHDDMWNIVNQASEGFALLYLLRFMKSLNKIYHHGEIMLGRVLNDMAENDDDFDKDLSDGVALEKLIDFAEAYGVEFDEKDIARMKFASTLAEKGIGWHKKRRRGNRKSRIDEGGVDVELD